MDAAGLRATAREFLAAHPGLGRAELLGLVEALWETDVFELRSVGVALLERRPKVLEPSDLPLLELLLRKAGTWAHVDWIAVHFVGPLVVRDASLGRHLDRWTRDEDFWMRRSAILALILPFRKGAGGDWRRLQRYADRMLGETEFFIRKAIGWALREVATRDPERVRAYVASRQQRMSGVTFREAVRKLPSVDRVELARRFRGTGT